MSEFNQLYVWAGVALPSAEDEAAQFEQWATAKLCGRQVQFKEKFEVDGWPVYLFYVHDDCVPQMPMHILRNQDLLPLKYFLASTDHKHLPANIIELGNI